MIQGVAYSDLPQGGLMFVRLGTLSIVAIPAAGGWTAGMGASHDRDLRHDLGPNTEE